MIDAGERVMAVRATRLVIPPVILTGLGCINSALKVLPGYTPMLTPEKVRELTHPDWVARITGPISKETDWHLPSCDR